jgi:hypothetical protein
MSIWYICIKENDEYFSKMHDEYFFSDYVKRIIEVFMDDFMVYGDYFDKCLENLMRTS